MYGYVVRSPERVRVLQKPKDAWHLISCCVLHLQRCLVLIELSNASVHIRCSLKISALILLFVSIVQNGAVALALPFVRGFVLTAIVQQCLVMYGWHSGVHVYKTHLGGSISCYCQLTVWTNRVS